MSLEHLKYILECVESIEKTLGGIHSRDDFFGLFKSYGGTLAVDSCVLKLEIIGEQVRAFDNRTGKSVLPLYPSVPWSDVIAMRNFIVHEYFKIDYDVIYSSIAEGLPPLKEAVGQILKDLQAELDRMPPEE